MSVIIRLQNLPWNANALDIRRYFQGLSIPDGGVHIIGGEKGDTFIAFSTDEDARQAMTKDGGAINGYVVKLLLSSKTEMQNVIAAAKGGPQPPVQVTPALGVPQKVIGFYDRPVIPPVGGTPMQFVGGGDVTGSGQGLRSSTGMGSMPAPYVYPGNQVISAPPAGSMVRMAEPRPLQVAPALPPPSHSIYDARPSDRPPVPGNLQPPPVMPLDPMAPGLRPPAAPGPAPLGAWNSSQPPMNRDLPPPDFSRPPDMLGNQGAAGFNPSLGREPVRLNGGPGALDSSYPRNVPTYGGAPVDGGRNFIPGLDAGRNLGPPPDVGRGDFGRGDGSIPLGRPAEQRDAGRFPPADGPSWSDRERRDPGRLDSGPAPGWSGGSQPFSGRDIESDRRGFSRPDDRGIPPPDRWLENRNVAPDRGPRDMPNERPLPMPGAVEPYDMYGAPNRPLAFSEGSSSRFGPDSGPPRMGGIPEGRPRGDERAGFTPGEPGFREPRSFMEEPTLRRPLPPLEPRWMEDRRGYGPPGPLGFEGRPLSPPRDRHFAGGGFPPRDEAWRGDRPEFDSRPVRDAGPIYSHSVRAEGFPKTFNYREIRRFFNKCEIPRDGVKLINDKNGMRTGVVYVQFGDARSLDLALSMDGKILDKSKIVIARCPDRVFDLAIDGERPKRGFDRSRSPRSRKTDEDPNVTHFVLKKLPAKTEKEDIRKFLGRFRITADGGPFFELAYDKTQTGNALVAIEERDAANVLSLHRTLFNGARVDVIKISSYEFVERSRRTRQCERETEKEAGTTSKPSASSSVSRDKKVEKQSDTKAKEVDHGGNMVKEEDGRRTGGYESEQRAYCIELRGVPYTCSAASIQDFFREITIPAEAVHVVYNREHRATGIAFVEFSSVADQKKAMEKDKQYMAHRFIEIRTLSKSAMIEEFNRQQQKFGGTPIPGPSGTRSAADRPKPVSAEPLLSMQNLHYDTQLEDILEFFSGYRPIVDSIKLQYKDQHPTGDGLIAFQTVQEAESALRNKNRHPLLGKPVTLSWAKN